MSNNKTGFKMKGYNDFFKPTDPDNHLKNDLLEYIATEKLVPFKNHPFKLYEGERFSDMVESIKANGILIPVIVRPLGDGTYEILSGHNRIETAKAAGLKEVPAIVRKDLNDDEALLIVTETNLHQRSFADLSHSERAAALTVHYEAIKHQGKRTDLINEIEKMLRNPKNTSENAGFETSAQVEHRISENEGSEVGAQVEHRLKSRDITAQRYGLNRNTVARYLRINKLSDPLKVRLDNGEFGIVPAVEVSYLADGEQKDLHMLLENQIYKLNMKNAAQLRRYLTKKPIISAKDIEEVLSGTASGKKNGGMVAVQSLKIKGKILSKYFTPEQKPEEIQAEIIEALEFFRENKN